MTNLSIVNVVATANLCQDVGFEELRREPEIFHDSDVYQGKVAYFKDETMQGRVSIFFSGKLISVGTKSEEQSFKELRHVAKRLAEKGFVNLVEISPKIQNLVVSGNLGKIVNFEKPLQKPNVVYKPKRFPALIVHLIHPYKATVLVFASGKIVISGLKSSSQIEQTVQEVLRIVE